jgi:hypothetical protein
LRAERIFDALYFGNKRVASYSLSSVFLVPMINGKFEEWMTGRTAQVTVARKSRKVYISLKRSAQKHPDVVILGRSRGKKVRVMVNFYNFFNSEVQTS